MLLKVERCRWRPTRSPRPRTCSATCCARRIEECLNLWFGKAEDDRPGDLEPLRRRRGARLARALRPTGRSTSSIRGCSSRSSSCSTSSRATCTARRRRCTPADARCQSLVKRGLRVGVGRAAAADRAGVPLPRPHPFGVARGPAPLHGGMGAGDGGADARRSAQRLPRNLPPPRRGDHALRPLPAPQQDPGRANTAAEEAFLADNSFRFDLPLVRQPDGTLAFAGSVKSGTVEAARPRVRDAPAGRRRGARQASSSSTTDRTRSSPRRRSSSTSRASSGSATRCRTSAAETSLGRDRFPRVHRRQLVRALLASVRLHPGLHDRTGRHRAARATSGRSAGSR